MTLAHRRLGLVLAPGNPAGITGLPDLARAGVRLSIASPAPEHASGWMQLDRLGIDPGRLSGYSDEALTYSDVARAVSGGQADAGLGIEAAALAYVWIFCRSRLSATTWLCCPAFGNPSRCKPWNIGCVPMRLVKPSPHSGATRPERPAGPDGWSRQRPPMSRPHPKSRPEVPRASQRAARPHVTACGKSTISSSSTIRRSCAGRTGRSKVRCSSTWAMAWSHVRRQKARALSGLTRDFRC